MNINLKQYFFELCKPFIEDRKVISECWVEIMAAYESQGRFYHNLDHVADLIHLSQRYKDFIKNLDVLRFAIFYHDLVYEIGGKDNETKSAAMARERMKLLGVSEEKVEKTSFQILATREHHLTGDNDTDYLLDFDLAILGVEWCVYEEYAAKIRKEYGIYPDEVYYAGRQKVLCHFLGLDWIFKTEAFREQWEQKARDNLTKELRGKGGLGIPTSTLL